MICKKCGSVVWDNDKFCSNCGEKQTVLKNPIQNAPDASFVDLSDQPSNAREPNRKLLLLSIATAVSLMIVVVLAVILIAAMRKPNTDASALRKPSISVDLPTSADPSPSVEPSTPDNPPTSADPSISVDQPVSPSRISLNTDLLSDIGSTYGAIRRKYGDGINISGFEGDLDVEFDTGYYRFISMDPYGSAYSGGVGFEAIPEDNAVCVAISTKAKGLLGDFNGSYTISDLKRELDLSAYAVFSHDFPYAGEMEGNYCHFEYEVCGIDIVLDTNGPEDGFTKNSTVYIEMNADDLESYRALYNSWEFSGGGRGEDDPELAYEGILNEYTEACRADDYDSEYFQYRYPNVNEEMIFYYHWDNNTSSFYYCYRDINNDGVYELFIGYGNDMHVSIVDLYLFDGYTAIKAFENDTLGARSALTLNTDGTLFEAGSSGAGSGGVALYRINPAGTGLEQIYAYRYEITETDWWYYNENEMISAEEFDAMSSGQTAVTSFDWIVLAGPKA